MVQAFIIYEESIPDSNAERRALYSIVGALQRCTTLSAESRDTLVHKARGYSAKLLKKSDQCRAICACSHLFWQSNPNVSPHLHPSVKFLRRSLLSSNIILIFPLDCLLTFKDLEAGNHSLSLQIACQSFKSHLSAFCSLTQANFFKRQDDILMEYMPSANKLQ